MRPTSSLQYSSEGSLSFSRGLVCCQESLPHELIGHICKPQGLYVQEGPHVVEHLQAEAAPQDVLCICCQVASLTQTSTSIS